ALLSRFTSPLYHSNSGGEVISFNCCGYPGSSGVIMLAPIDTDLFFILSTLSQSLNDLNEDIDCGPNPRSRTKSGSLSLNISVGRATESNKTFALPAPICGINDNATRVLM